MKGKKKILLAVALVLVMAVGITSIVVIRNRNKTVVKVFPVSMLNSSDWFDTDTSLTGTLTSDYIQEVHIDGGQKVKKVYVKKGDKVKKGDILLKYNVSEKELDLKLQKLQIQSSKMEIAEMEKELKKLKNTKTVGAVNTGNSDVMNASVNLSAIKGTSLSYLVAEANGNTEGTSSDVKVQSGNAVSKSGSGSGSESGSGSGSGSESGSGSGSGSESGSGSGETKLVLRDHVSSEADKAATSGAGTKEDDSLIFTLTKNGTISGAFVKKLISEGKYAEFRSYKSEESKNPIATFELSPDTKVNVYDNDNYTVNKLNEGGDSRTLHNSIESVSERDSSSGDGSSAGNAYIYYLNVNGRVKGSVIKSLHDSKKYATFIEFDENGKEKNRYEYNPDRVFTDLEEDGLYKVSDFDNLTIRPAYKDLKADKLEDGDDNNGGGSDDGSGSGSGDGIDDGTDSSGGDDNGYTAEELKAAISDKEDDIAQAKEDLHDAQISYKEAKAEVDKATVKAKLAGTVTTAYSKGTLPTDGSAAIVVKAADGMYVKTSISEMELDSVKVGGTIKCVSSDTGDEYTAEVKEISDFPTADSSNGGDVSNPNSSYYPIVAFIKDADGLSPGGSVEVSYSSKSMGTANENAVYLQKAYIRTEDKKSYVYLRDKKTKRLKKQYITIGKTMNGQYIEIVSGVTEDDNIAFPYGKNLREGVKTKISEDDSEMIY